jgi:hypothetical protein
MTPPHRRQSRIHDLLHAILTPEDPRPVHTWAEKQKWPARPNNRFAAAQRPSSSSPSSALFAPAGTGTWAFTSPPLAISIPRGEEQHNGQHCDDDDDDDDDDDTARRGRQQGDAASPRRVCWCCDDESGPSATAAAAAAALAALSLAPDPWISMWESGVVAGSSGIATRLAMRRVLEARAMGRTTDAAPAVAAGSTEWRPTCAVVSEGRGGGGGDGGNGAADEKLAQRLRRDHEDSDVLDWESLTNGEVHVAQSEEGARAVNPKLACDAMLGDACGGGNQGGGGKGDSDSRSIEGLSNLGKDVGGAKGTTTKRTLGQWAEEVSSPIFSTLKGMLGKYRTGEVKHGKELISK